MVTGSLKNKVDSLWLMFWTGGLTNPLDVIEQITYLMFIRDLDRIYTTRQKESVMLKLHYKSIFPEDMEYLKWSNFRNMPPAEMYDTVMNKVFPFIKSLHADKESTYSKYMSDAIFKIPTPQLLDKIVAAVDDLDPDEKDTTGDLYEYLLSKIATSGTNGQFRTPRHIIRMMVEMLAPVPGDTICDPACGTAGFLVSAGEYLRDKHTQDIFYNKTNREHYNNKMFSGYDMDRTMLRIGAMNMMTHGVENPNIEYKDSLSDQNTDTNKYSIVLANPPFKGSLDYDIVSANLLKVTKTKKTELLFLALFLRVLRTGGRCACIVPDGVLFGSSNAHKAIRKEIIENNKLQAVISMPSGVFKPYAGVSTAILIFTKTGYGGTNKVWFYDMKSDGYSLDDKRTELGTSDIPGIIARFHNLKEEDNRKRTDQSFFVPKQEIVDNGYDLSINKYKKVDYIPEELPKPSEIMEGLHELEMQITAGLAELEKMLHE